MSSERRAGVGAGGADGMRVGVVGAGVFGLTAALALRDRGCAVVVFDAGEIPRVDSASHDISKAVRADYGDDVFYTEWMERAFDGWLAWNRASGAQLFRRCGIVFATSEPMTAGGFEAGSFECMRQRGAPVRRLDASSLAELLPGFAAGHFVDGYSNASGGFADAERVMHWLAERARAAGCELRPRTRIVRIDAAGGTGTSGRPSVRDARGDEHRFDRLLIATGAWSLTASGLLPELAPLLRTTGQVVFYVSARDRIVAPDVLWGSDLATTGWFGFPPHRDGIVKVANHGPGIGGVPGEVVPDEVLARCRAAFARFVETTAPGLHRAGAPLETRVCYYTDTADGDFLIDAVPGRPGVCVATGGSGHAFKFAPVLGEAIADVVLARSQAPGRSRASGRFAWRDGSANGPRERARAGGGR